MQLRSIRLYFRRRLGKGQRQVESLSTQAEQRIEHHIFKRFGHLRPIRRFVIGWLGLMLLLCSAVVYQNLLLNSYYQTLRAVPGGIYTEGVLGRFTNASPLFATSEADTTVSRLVFAGLFNYDRHGKLVGDLAKDYTVSPRGDVYTVHLKPKLTWHDGRPLTSADVVFTYQSIQNPDAKSPLQSSWQGIVVTATSPSTIIFKLPGGLAAFPYNLTNGIVPKHLLASIPPADLRSADFNTVHPVGAGPFAWEAVQVNGNANPKTVQEQVELKPFAHYQGGAPKLQKFAVHVFASESQLIHAFGGGQLTSVEGLTSVPRELAHKSDIVQHNLSLRAANMVFFKTTSGVLADQKVRQSLVQAANVPEIINRLGYPTRAVREPLLQDQPGYDKSLVQSAFKLSAAQLALDADGWKVGFNSNRSKANKPLAFTLTAADTAENRRVAGLLQQQWQKAGVQAKLLFLPVTEFQNALTYHDYDALLNGISIGPDPDVFVYWDSSQADIRSSNRLNFSEYKNTTADAALEAGRTRSDPTLRTIKYKPFVQAWQQDSPALGLYQPRVLYLTNGAVAGLADHTINTATDRFADVQNWEIREAKVAD